jgi:group I intron endonuclease
MNRFGVIYLATNKHTGEQYVGQTCEKLTRRVTNHKASIGKYKTKFALAMQHYGFENFEFKEVFTAFGKNELDTAEKELVAEFNSIYNMTKGGSGLRGYKPTQETIKKQRNTMQQRLQDPAIRVKWVQAQIGRKHPKEEVERTARAKWKPVYCKELGISFLNQKYAAEYLGIRPSTVVEAMKRKGRVANKFTLVRVV